MMDTATSCRDLAAGDSAKARAEPLDSRRAILEASATAWTFRAETLERVDRLTAKQGRAPLQETSE